jgi:hypothetical protein
MIAKLIDAFFFILYYVELARVKFINQSEKFPMKNQMILIANYINNFEMKLKTYNPISTLIAFLIFVVILKFIIKRTKRIWSQLSK